MIGPLLQLAIALRLRGVVPACETISTEPIKMFWDARSATRFFVDPRWSQAVPFLSGLMTFALF
jgi:hypothetical protein